VDAAAVPPGVVITGLSGSPVGLAARPTGAEPVTIFGPGGEPLARSAAGSWSVNEASPGWRIDAAAHDEAVLGPIGPDVAPVWRNLGPNATFLWNDPRIQFADTQPDRRSPSDLPWSIDLQVGEHRASVTGRTVRVPIAGSARPSTSGSSWQPVAIALGAAVAALAVLVGAVHRRRRGVVRRTHWSAFS
jgi:hypothetical protein